MGQYVFKMPDIGEGIVEAEIVKWYVNIGDQIEEEATVADVMTDKATVEITAPVGGKVTFVGCDEGESLSIGADFVVFDYEGEDVGELGANDASSTVEPSVDSSSAEATEAEQTEPEQQPKTSSSTPEAVKPPPTPGQRPGGGGTLPRPAGEKPLASPAVRKRALEHGVQLSYVHGTGPANRITQNDLDAYLAGTPVGGAASSRNGLTSYQLREGEEQIKVIGLRKAIARSTQKSKQDIPHFSYIEEVDVTELEKLRGHLNSQKTEDQPKLTLLPFVIRAIINVIVRSFPQMNATFDGVANVITQHQPIHLGMAAQTPNGLMVPVIKHAEALDIWQLADEVKRLAIGARENTLSPEELTGSTITVTSLGPLGGLATTPVINQPEVAIVGPNKITDKLTLDNGQLMTRKVMNISSSFDHRVLDGVEAAEFVQAIRAQLEHPATLFI